MMLGRPLARVGAVFAFCCCLAACGGDSPATAPAAQAGSHGIDAPAEPVAGASVGRAADAGPGSGSGQASGHSEVLESGAPSRRYALVFGNGAYRHGDALASPPRDAALVARALETRGYRVLLARDRDLAGMREDLRAFDAMSKGADLRVLYFAGHGFEFDSANYLMPVDLPASVTDLDRDDVRTNALRLDQVVDGMEREGGPLVVIVDACRVVPARGAARARALAAERPPQGTILAFATGPGQVAMDSLRNYGIAEDDSPYSWFLADILSDPATTTWDQAFRSVYGIVSNQTRGEQKPWMNAMVTRFPEIGPAAAPAQGREDTGASLAGILGVAVSPERRAAARYWAREAEAVQRLARDAASDATLQRRARQGDAQAAMALAAREWIRPGHEAQVVRLLEPVARQGNALAQVDLGTQLYAIRGEDSRGRSARYWWRLASDQGIGEARFKLAALDGGADAESRQELLQGMAEMVQGSQGSE